MANRRANAARKELRPWQSANTDSREKIYVQIGKSLFESKAFHDLSKSARLTYLCMVSAAGFDEVFNFPQASMVKRFDLCPRSVRRDIDELVKAGFITKQSGKVTREPNIYRFSYEWKTKAQPPSGERPP